MHNVLNPLWQYSKRQTRAEEIERCLDEDLEPTYYSGIFTIQHFTFCCFTRPSKPISLFICDQGLPDIYVLLHKDFNNPVVNGKGY